VGAGHPSSFGELKRYESWFSPVPLRPSLRWGAGQAAAALSPLDRVRLEPEAVAQRTSFERLADGFARRDDQAGLFARHSSTS
jgi:hypothetical protein